MKDEVLARGLASQMLASIQTLKACMDRCPDAEWNQAHKDWPFSQVLFHTLFDCDLSLCRQRDELKEQAFHRQNQAVFADYEELGDGPRKRVYDRDFLNRYYEHCQRKISLVIEGEASANLLVPKSDIYGNMTRCERYVNAIRHIQHHAAQLGLRLQYLDGRELDWISRAYED
jgi:hypothetical protein